MTNKEYAIFAGKFLSEKKATDIVVIDIQNKATFADYLVIASGSSSRQINAMSDDLKDKMAENGLFLKQAEGKGVSDWVLLDFGDVIVNLFAKEKREKFNLEKVWGDCESIEIEE